MTVLGLMLAACAPATRFDTSPAPSSPTVASKQENNVSPHSTSVPEQQASAPARLPDGPVAPELATQTWLNSAPLHSADLRGKVVLIDFWTFS
jgi:hypothetical protein